MADETARAGWAAGESDAGITTRGPLSGQYQQLLMQEISTLRNLFGFSSMPVVVVQVPPL